MKASNLIKLTLLFLTIVGFTLTGCNKKKENNVVDPSNIQQLANDENQFQDASDEAMYDVDLLLSTGNLKSTTLWPCNATIDSTAVANDTLTIFITYNGLNCSETRFRTGQVIIKKRVGLNWGDAGAGVVVQHINFSITRVSTGKTIVLNGTKTHQNVSGGHFWMLGNTLTSLVHKTWGTMTVTFDDNTTRTWNVARMKTYTGVLTNLVLTVDGFGTSGEFNNLVIWGVNRQGDAFYSQIQQPEVFKQMCAWSPCSGIKLLTIPGDGKSALITFGYNSNNQPIGENECPTKFKLDWTKNGNSGTVYLWL